MPRVPGRHWALVTAALILMQGGCDGHATQSALHPAGPAAEKIAWLTGIMVAAFTAIAAIVVGLVLFAIFHTPRLEEAAPPLGRTRFIVAGGVGLPVVVLIPILFYALETSSSLRTPVGPPLLKVVGHMWWWEVRYPGHDIVTANEVHIPVGERVRVDVESADVIHSFWVPRLNGKRDMIPGLRNVTWLQADEPGVYRGQCAEYCGDQHAKMAFVVVAHTPEDFQAWLAERKRSIPESDLRTRGLAIFTSAGCARCHSISGTTAAGVLGPDLTHIATRRTLAAGILPNNRGNLAGWITDPRPIKPGVKMPASYLNVEERETLVDFLESLK